MAQKQGNHVAGTLEELKAAIDQHPDEWDRYIVYGDCLEENGFDDLALAYRWMGQKHKRPFYRTGARVRKRWAWNWSTTNHAFMWDQLPTALTLVVAKYPGITDAMIYNTEEEALLSLADGLKQLRKALD